MLGLGVLGFGKTISAFTCLVLVISLSPISAFSSQKVAAGVACTKMNAKTVVKNKTFICVKKGSRLVWGKGASLKTPSSKKPPSRTPVALPTPTPTPIPTKTPSPNSGSTLTVGETIAREVSTIFKSQTSKSALLDVYYSPTTNRESSIVNRNVEDAYRSIKYWELLGLEFNQKIALIFVTEKDQAWWKDFKTRLGSSEHELDKTTFANHATQPFMGYAGISGRSNSLNAPFHVLLFLSGGLESTRDKYWAETMAAHEFAHIIQFMSIEKDGSFNDFERYACWFIEGLARFYERSTQFDRLYEGNLTYHEMKLKQLGYFDYIIPRETTYGPVTNWSEAVYLQFLVDNQYRDKSDVCRKTGYGYSIGWPITEKFYLDFGPKTILKVMQEVKSTSDWDLAFKNATGQEHKSWLTESAIPYLLKQR